MARKRSKSTPLLSFRISCAWLFRVMEGEQKCQFDLNRISAPTVQRLARYRGNKRQNVDPHLIQYDAKQKLTIPSTRYYCSYVVIVHYTAVVISKMHSLIPWESEVFCDWSIVNCFAFMVVIFKSNLVGAEHGCRVATEFLSQRITAKNYSN